jgi:hypothetical protein
MHRVPGMAKVVEHKRVDALSRAYRKITGLVAPSILLEYDIKFALIILASKSGQDITAEVRNVLCDVVDKALAIGTSSERRFPPEQHEPKDQASKMWSPPKLTTYQRGQWVLKYS